MSTHVYYHPRESELDLADLPLWLYNEIASWHGQITASAPVILTCLGNGEPMYVWRNKHGRYFARHFPGGSPGDGHTHSIATMSDEHRRQAEYLQRAAADHGFDATLERSTGNGTRLDVAITGNQDAAVEVQRSHLTRARAERRTKLSFDAGWPTAWVTDSEGRPDWVDYVPTARMPTATLFHDSVPPRGSARIVIGKYIRARDRRRPTGWRYQREPHVIHLDDLPLMAAGEIVPVSVGTKGKVDLAYADAVDIIDSATYPGASRWKPSATPRRSKEAAERISRACSHEDTAQLCAICGGLILFRPEENTLCAKCSGLGPIVRRGGSLVHLGRSA